MEMGREAERSSLVWLLLLYPAALIASSTCPPNCRCLWRYSKITVECSQLGLTGLPTGLDPATQVLSLSGNNLTELQSQIFVAAKLENLQKIVLATSAITAIHEQAFNGLLNLVELDLAGNQLAEVPSHAFHFTTGLMGLSLASNPIYSLKSGAFKELRQLAKLDLSHCSISAVEEGAFQGLERLERLELHANSIATLAAGSGQLPTSLHGITLHENPWECDCRLRDLKDWLSRSNVPRTVEPVCERPVRLQGFRVGVLSAGEFACLPVISPTSTAVSGEEGRNLSLTCRVMADPPAEIFWNINNRKVDPAATSQTGRVHFRQQYEGPSQGYRSDLTLANVTAGRDNGTTLTCSARNRAGLSLANYTLTVLPPSAAATSRLMGGALELRMEHFLVVSISVIVVLLILVIAVTLLLVHVCRRRLQQKEGRRPDRLTTNHGGKELLQSRANAAAAAMGGGGGVGTISCHMPKNIQMGTSKLPGTYMGSKAGAGVVGHFVVMPPDLLTEAAHILTPDSSCVSMETVSTPCHSSNSSSHNHSTPSTSDHSDISSIMKDYGNLDRGQPIIGQYREERTRWGQEKEEQRRKAARQQQQRPAEHGRLFSLLNNQDTYPATVPPPPPPADADNEPPWTNNNPYIHTSRPYRLPLVKPVGPDEKYPPSSVRPHQHQQDPGRQQDYHHNAASSLTDSFSDPLYESITSLRYPPGLTIISGRSEMKTSAPSQQTSTLPRSSGSGVSCCASNQRGIADGAVAKHEALTPQQHSPPIPAADSSGGGGGGGGGGYRTEPVIGSSDSVQDILRKLSGDYAVRADSPEISRELEYAFLAQTEETNI